MVVTAGKRLKSENGASLVAALLFFVLCGVAASMILAAASASAGKMQQVPVTDQKRFAVESGAAFLRDELSDSKTAVKITDVRVVDSREEEPDYSEEYVYTGGETLDDDSILGTLSIWSRRPRSMRYSRESPKFFSSSQLIMDSL